MALFGTASENALHCLLLLIDRSPSDAPSARDLAEFQGISLSYTAKIFTKLEKAGIVAAGEGIRGGFKLAKPPADISVLDVVDAVEDGKRLFECRNIRADCILFEKRAPDWAQRGTCAIHAVMLEAEQALRASLAQQSIEAIADRVGRQVPAEFGASMEEWFAERSLNRFRPLRNGR